MTQQSQSPAERSAEKIVPGTYSYIDENDVVVFGIATPEWETIDGGKKEVEARRNHVVKQFAGIIASEYASRDAALKACVEVLTKAANRLRDGGVIPIKG